MKQEELEQLVKEEFREVKSAAFALSVLTACPKIVMTYEHPSTRYTDPTEVVEYFQNHADDIAYRAGDGYIYFNDPSAIRMKDISEAMNRIFASEPIRKYLKGISSAPKSKLLPDWTLFKFEGGLPHGKKSIYFSACYAIPGEDYYTLCFTASRKEKASEAEVSIFITHPESMHFDGEDHGMYPYHLLLAKGTVSSPELLKRPEFKALPAPSMRR